MTDKLLPLTVSRIFGDKGQRNLTEEMPDSLALGRMVGEGKSERHRTNQPKGWKKALSAGGRKVKFNFAIAWFCFAVLGH
jgi:hypothetical protein